MTTCLTLGLAAKAALALALQGSWQYEHGGAILQDEVTECYVYTPPQQGTYAAVRIRAVIPDGYRLAALYHTHPRTLPESLAEAFSKADIDAATHLGVPSFLAIKSGNIMTRVFIPGVRAIKVCRDVSQSTCQLPSVQLTSN